MRRVCPYMRRYPTHNLPLVSAQIVKTPFCVRKLHNNHAYNIHTYMHTIIHTYMHTIIHTYMHTIIHTYMHTIIHTCIRSYIHTYIRSYIHTCIRSYIHTYMHGSRALLETYCNNSTRKLQALQPLLQLPRNLPQQHVYR